jgi:hypothetical protein
LSQGQQDSLTEAFGDAELPVIQIGNKE